MNFETQSSCRNCPVPGARGIMILVFSIVSLIGGSVGGGIGAILSIVGGTLALIVKV